MQVVYRYVGIIKVRVGSAWQVDSSDTVKNADFETCTVKLSIPQMLLQCLFVRINSCLILYILSLTLQCLCTYDDVINITDHVCI